MSLAALEPDPCLAADRRVAALAGYAILDTPTEPDFDDIAALAAQIFGAPVAIVNLVADDRQWFKAEFGLGMRELPLEVSICAHALLQDDTLVIPDTRLDPRLANNPLVAGDDGPRFYAGALLRTPAGVAIGTVCVLDRVPRLDGITAVERLTLEVLARQVMTQLELRRQSRLQTVRAQQLEHEASERRHAQARRDESESFTRLLLDSTSEAFYSVATDGATTLCNDAFLKMLGFADRSEVIGQKLHDLIHHSHTDGTPYAVDDCPIYRAASAGTPAFVTDEVFFRRDGGSFPVEYRAEPIWDAGSLRGAICTFVDASERRRATEQQALLLRELDHRVKNLFAVVRGVVSLSARSAASVDALKTTVLGRLDALSAAQSLIRTPASSTGNEATSFEAIAAAVLAPYADGVVNPRVTMAGPEITLGRDAATSLALVCHELATNAVKYGALAAPDGRVDLAWHVADGQLVVDWRESGGPALDGPPPIKGFGSVLARQSITHQLGGTIHHDWAAAGLLINISVPSERLLR